jgi:nuclear pore complex protein Nup210
VLDPIATVENPAISLITAKDQLNSQEMLRCEVKVGRIHSLAILTTVRSIRVGSSEVISVQAFDEAGNVFSSVEGLRFYWTIERGQNSLDMRRLSETNAAITETRRQVETNYGNHCDEILITGKATGKALVTVEIREKGYEHVRKAEAEISVSEPFVIVPSTLVYSPPRAILPYKLFKILDQSIYRKINLPSAEYNWSAAKNDILAVYKDGNVLTLDKTEKDVVKVVDTKIEENFVTCEVHVVAPDKVLITVEPFTEIPAEKEEYEWDEFTALNNQDEVP